MEIFDVKSFEDAIKEGTTVVDFFATWCGPCKMLAPVLESAASGHADIKFGKIDIDKDMDVALKYKVMSVPTLIKFKDGEVVDKSIGFVSQAELEDFLAR